MYKEVVPKGAEEIAMKVPAEREATNSHSGLQGTGWY